MRPRADLLLFVYGTLQKGQYLHNYIKDSVVGDPVSAAVRGKLYEHITSDYPLGVFTYTDDFIYGQTIRVVLSPKVVDVFDTEMRAGYVPVWMEELDPDELEPTGRTVLAFDFNDTIGSDKIGLLIPSGDWLLNRELRARKQEIGKETTQPQATSH